MATKNKVLIEFHFPGFEPIAGEMSIPSNAIDIDQFAIEVHTLVNQMVLELRKQKS